MKHPNQLAALLCIILGACILLFARSGFSAPLRNVRASGQSLTLIRTALGFSTIVEFPGKPTSAVLGDQDAVKLEYVGESITLKPLVGNVHTNLFVFVGSRRYAFSIQSSPRALVDYVVRVSDADEKTRAPEQNPGPVGSYRIIRLGRRSSSSGIILSATRLQLNRDTSDPRAASLIEFELYAEKSPSTFTANSFGLSQNGRYLDMESIAVDRLIAANGAPPVKGTIALLNQDWNRSLPVTLVFAFMPKNGKSRNPRRITVAIDPSPRSGLGNQKWKEKERNGTGELFPKISP